MAYKKYIKRGGKLYGPYLYESKRVNGKVVSEYHGPKKNAFPGKILAVVASAIFLIGAVYFLSQAEIGSILTGNAVLGTSAEYMEGVPLSGNIVLSLKQGELIPADSMLVLENEGQRYEYSLKSILPYETKTGNFHIEGSGIEGEGEGFGEEGEATIYPAISFVLISSQQEPPEEIPEEQEEVPTETPEENNETVSEENSSQADENAIMETQSSQEPASNESLPDESAEVSSGQEANAETTTETNPETSTEQTSAETESETPSETTESTQESSPSESVLSNFFLGIYNFFIGLTPTGLAVDTPGSNVIEISGETSEGNPFVYESSGSEELSLKPGSVYLSGVQLPDDSVRILKSNSVIYVETSYSELSNGFGTEYIKDGEVLFNANLSDLGLLVNGGQLKTSLIYNNEEIMSNALYLVPGLNSNSSSISNISGLAVNVTIPENATLAENQTDINLTAPPLQVITFETAEFVLTESEKELLAEKFGNEEIKTTTKIFNERIIVTNEIGNYWIENSYDLGLPENELNYQMSADRMKWLKDVAYRLNAEKIQEQSQETEESSPIF